uniref:Uncharacterized protein n=1 Tax=Siphoviridae sp. ctBLh2 TaxID=2827803 RepID=A0A8S5S3K9_9CAUD|nr:MAG TPA: hypothetical protein [Siphoviridae sp. ctBLh2]
MNFLIFSYFRQISTKTFSIFQQKELKTFFHFRQNTYLCGK